MQEIQAFQIYFEIVYNPQKLSRIVFEAATVLKTK